MGKGSFDLPEMSRVDGQTFAPVRVILVKVVLPDDPSRDVPALDPLEEARALVATRGHEIAGTILQRRTNPHPRTYVGKGKLDEIRALVEAERAQLLVVDDSLSPSQGKNLEEAAGIPVLDRTELIIEIFATHARTHQSKLQVELAQLRYSQSRLKRMWTHLSRYEGGIGMRGPGETQIETDRRIIRKKVATLEDRLAEIEQQSETMHKGREDTFQVALVGYTNAGKSSLMRRLTGADVLIENQLFSTLDTCTRRWELPCAHGVILSDTVGFIRNLPHMLVASFHATLLEAREADLLLHVVDGSTSRVEVDMAAVEETLRVIDCANRPRLILFNKIDLLPEERRIDLQYLLERYPESIAMSVVDGTGIEELAEYVVNLVTSEEKIAEYRLPIHRGDLVARLRTIGTLLDERYEEDGIVVRARLTPDERQRFGSLLARSGITPPDGAPPA